MTTKSTTKRAAKNPGGGTAKNPATSGPRPPVVDRDDAGDTDDTTTNVRGILLAVVAIVIGVVALFLPTVALRSIGLVFGVYLIVAGIIRVFDVREDPTTRGARRWVQYVLGALVVVAGVLCLNNPFESASALSLVIGLGWVLDGLAALAVALVGGRRGDRSSGGSGGGRGRRRGGRWRLAAVAAVNIAVGIAFIVIPHATLTAFVVVAAVMLLIVGVTMLLVLVPWGDGRPSRAKGASL